MGGRKTGNELIAFADSPIGFRLCDFWSWSFSDLLDNTLRGSYSEFIVAAALGLDLSTGRINWEPWDLNYPYKWNDDFGAHDVAHIEVKSCSYIQSWEQKKPSAVSFSIRPTRAWSAESGYSEEVRRQSDMYVFCVYAETDPAKANPLILDAWEFFVVSTKTLNEVCGTQKTISLPSLMHLAPLKANYSELAEAVQRCLRGENNG